MELRATLHTYKPWLHEKGRIHATFFYIYINDYTYGQDLQLTPHQLPQPFFSIKETQAIHLSLNLAGCKYENIHHYQTLFLFSLLALNEKGAQEPPIRDLELRDHGYLASYIHSFLNKRIHSITKNILSYLIDLIHFDISPPPQ